MNEPSHFDHEGFLIHHERWSEGVAQQIAKTHGIELSTDHFRVLFAARRYYERYERSPEMRPFQGWLKRSQDERFASSIALMQLFPDETVRLISKIAGLPKPSSCL